jgi:BMFP domain-containing protein YqiC
MRPLLRGRERACQAALAEPFPNAIFKPNRKEAYMQTRNKVLDDVAQLFSNAMGVAQGARAEAETALKSLLDRWLADRNLVTREEFDAVRAMAQKAREENEALKARIESLESRSN